MSKTPAEPSTEGVKPEFAAFVDTPQKRFLYDWGRKDGYQDGYAAALDEARPAEPSTGEREAFETFVQDQGYVTLEKKPDGLYWSSHTRLMWESWHASARNQQRTACNFCLDQARAALAAQAPSPVACSGGCCDCGRGCPVEAPSPVAPSEPTDTDILSLMLCWAEGNTGDGEQGTDSEHIAEMRALFAKRAAIQPRQAEPPSDDTAAYHRGWHDGNATAKAAAVAEPRQAPSDALEADMFWEADGERFAPDIDEIVADYGPGEVVKIERAKSLPTITVGVITDPLDPERLTYEVILSTQGGRNG